MFHAKLLGDEIRRSRSIILDTRIQCAVLPKKDDTSWCLFKIVQVLKPLRCNEFNSSIGEHVLK